MYGNLGPVEPNTFKERCKHASRAVAAGEKKSAGWLLAAYPAISSNPFLEMLYSASVENGFGCVRMKKLAQAAKLPRKTRTIIHLHWVHRAFGASGNIASMSARDAKKSVDGFLKGLRREQDAGRQIMWTVHNIMSHSAAFPEEERELRAGVAEIADHIHIMNPKTVSLCAPLYALPKNKIFEVAHPSYLGIYEDTLSRDEARRELRLSLEDKVFLIFGRLGAYKGTERFLGQIDHLQNRVGGKAKLIIAGSGMEPAVEQGLRPLAEGRSDVMLDTSYVDDAHVQRYFRAADVVVCGQKAGLNSGVAHTAASFGCPVVVSQNLVPSLGGAENFVFPFEAENPASIVDASIAALQASAAPDRAQLLAEWARERAPNVMSKRFFEKLRARLS